MTKIQRFLKIRIYKFYKGYNDTTFLRLVYKKLEKVFLFVISHTNIGMFNKLYFISRKIEISGKLLFPMIDSAMSCAL